MNIQVEKHSMFLPKFWEHIANDDTSDGWFQSPKEQTIFLLGFPSTGATWAPDGMGSKSLSFFSLASTSK